MKKNKMDIVSSIILIVFFVAYYLPIIVLAVFSFNENKSATIYKGFTLKWYVELFNDKALMQAIFWTFIIAVLATLISTIIGTLASVALAKQKIRFRKLVLGANNLPIINPDIVTAICLLLLFIFIGIDRGYGTMLISHIVFCVPYVIITVYPKVRSLDPNLEEAAIDLGATPYQALRKVIIPEIKVSILAGAALAFTMSFDDFIISYLTSGTAQNVSIYIYNSIKRYEPKVNALSVFIILFIIIKVLIDIRKNKKARALEEE